MEYEGSFTVGRKMKLHSVAHRTLNIMLHDFVCACGNVVTYDGQGDGIFCASQHHSFCRELLDNWVLDVCGLGLTFIEAFHSSKRMLKVLAYL